MAVTTERIKKYRRWFGWGFVASLPLLWLVLMIAWTDTIVALASFATSCATLIGLVVTTVITWRKEGRESVQTNIELEKKTLELEQLRREIGDKNAAAQEKKKKMTKRKRWVG